jgi:hypothetical protein
MAKRYLSQETAQDIDGHGKDDIDTNDVKNLQVIEVFYKYR